MHQWVVLKNNIKIYIKTAVLMYQSFIYSSTDAPVSCLKNKIIIYIKTAVLMYQSFIYSPIDAPVSWLTKKTILKFTLKQFRHVSVLQLHHHQRAH